MMRKTVTSLRFFINRVYRILFNKKPFDETFKKFDESKTWKKVCQELFGQYLGQYSCTRSDHIGDLIEELGILSQNHVLDLGSGLGGLSTFLANETGCKLTGVDVSQEAVKRANRYAASQNMSKQVSFITNLLPKLPYQNNHFDKIISIDSVYAVPDKARLFDECYRVLKPGGQIGFYSVYFIKELIPENPEQRRALRWKTPKVYEKLLEDAGFEDVSKKDYTADLIQVARKWVELMEETREALIKELGKKTYEGVLANQKPAWKLAESGYIKRSMFKAKKHLTS